MSRNDAYYTIARFLSNNLNSDDDRAEYLSLLDELYARPAPSEPSEAMVDEHLEAILTAAGTTFRHYTMHEVRQRMRVAMRAALLAAMAEGAKR